MIPDVSVDRKTGAVSNSTGNVTLYINGEEADYRDVQSCVLVSIEKVEYYDIPIGKYTAINAHFVNYIVLKRQTGGYLFADGKQKTSDIYF